MLRASALTIFVLVLLLLPGCLQEAGLGDPAASAAAPATSESDMTTSKELEPCGTQVQALRWTLPSSYKPSGDSGSEAFSVPSGATQIVVAGTSGSFVQAKWKFTVVDDAKTPVFQYTVMAPATAAGENNNVPRGTKAQSASAGNHTFEWSVEGAVSKLEIRVTYGTCVAADQS